MVDFSKRLKKPLKFEKYTNLDTMELLEKADSFFMSGGNPRYTRMAVDTETNGLKFYKNVVIGVSISTDRDSGFYIPFLRWVPDEASEKIRSIDKVKRPIYLEGEFECVWTGERYPENVTSKDYKPPQEVVAYLERWLVQEDLQILMHNAPFDVLMIKYNLGFDLTELVFCDTALLKHVIDENTSIALKETANQWSKELGYDAEGEAKAEQTELGETVIRNGGKFNARSKHVWRGDYKALAKYAIKDTCLTFGVFEVGVEKLLSEYSEKHFDWFFEDEVMPVCREVCIPMKEGGLRIDVPHFKKLESETREVMESLEDEIIEYLGEILDNFTVGQSIDEAVSNKKLVETIMQMEGLEYPTQVKNGEAKQTLAKGMVKKVNAENPHWLWGYILGDNPLKYPEKKLHSIKMDLYRETLGRRHRFNIGSDQHLRWLFCDHFGFEKTKLPQTDSATPENPIPSMKAEVLKDFFLKDYKEIVKPLLLYKKLSKLYGTYITPALELEHNGYLYMDMKQAGTVSGRFACSGGYNLQTLPQVEELDVCPSCKSKNIIVVHPIEILAVIGCNDCGHEEEDILCSSAIKKGFIAPEGAKIVNADYSSLEPRCFSFMSGDSRLKAVFLEGLDMYSKVYCDMMEEEYRNLKKTGENEKRQPFKKVPLGIAYGARDPQVANMMELRKKKAWTDQETGEVVIKDVLDIEKGAYYRNLFLTTYPDLRKYMQKQEITAITKGYVETIVGRRRHFVYTVPVAALLREAEISVDSFLDMRTKQLKTRNLNKVMDIEALKELSKFCGFKLVDDKGVPRDWKYIHSMFKNEMNNAKNVPIQGLAAHITNRGMLETARLFKARGINARVVLNVHDEITCYSFEADHKASVQTLQEGMEKNKYAQLLDIPMIAEPILCSSLKESK